MSMMMVLPFQTMWMQARAGQVQAGDFPISAFLLI
jgi:hypothetical protein